MANKRIQYWLAELDQYGNPTLTDGPHSRRSGANQAAYLITRLRLGKPDRKFAVARVEITDCVPSDKGVNKSALEACSSMTRFVERKHS